MSSHDPSLQQEALSLQRRFKGADAREILAHVQTRFGRRAFLASSLGAEDQLLTHMLLSNDPITRVVVLDTGRLPEETYRLMTDSMARYGFRYEIYFPSAAGVEALMREHGPNPFLKSVDLRKACCGIRKVEPLRRALATADAWVTGLRAAQSVGRSGTSEIEWDAANGMIKINPLAGLSTAEVWRRIHAQHIPYSPLHDKGYPSIGCAPCTRAVTPGEKERAGRWWWEREGGDDAISLECGIHRLDNVTAPKSTG